MNIIPEFKTIVEILKQSKICWWMDCGVLLHYYRDNDISGNDYDFGFFIDDKFKSYDTLKEILESHKEMFEWIHYRNREISLKMNGIKFDFIGFQKEKDLLYCYAYKSNPFTYNKWNWEWRCIFPYKIYFPISHININNIEINTPKNIPEKLRIHYGDDWKFPKPNIVSWTDDLNPSKDITYNPIAVIMTTIARDNILLQVLPSYLQYPIKIYLLDQGNHSEKKDAYYNELRQKGHFIEYSQDIGLSAARNYLLSKVTEEYVFMTEDDIELTSNPYILFQEFDNNNLGILGGLLIREGKEQHYEYELKLENNAIEYIKSNKIDLVLNFFLAKRRVFNDILYDNELFLSEHTDFFLRLKQLNKYKVKYTRNLTGTHHVIRTNDYMQYRSRSAYYSEKFKNKWNIERVFKDGIEIKQPIQKELTVFILTHDNEPNFNNCLSAIKSQNIDFSLEIIKNYHPMSVAFQEMLDRCKTKYFIQIDSDFIMNPDSLETMLKSIKLTKENEAMVCFKLHDWHLDKPIDGVKIYKHNIFKQYPYKNVMSCEMEQLDRLTHDGYTYIRKSEILGIHSPIWTIESIFERYFNYMEKNKKFNKESNPLLETLIKIFIDNPTNINLYAFLGAIVSATYPENKNTEKDYTKPILNNFKNILNININNNFVIKTSSYVEPNKTKKLVLQIASIPCANRPYEINNLINKYSEKYESRHILCSQYSPYPDIPYREFPYDLFLKHDLVEIIDLINRADIIHIHHRVDPRLKKYLLGKTNIVWTVSNLSQSIKNNNDKFNVDYANEIKSYTKTITTTNEPLQKIAFDYLTDIHLPLVKNLYNCETTKNNIRPIIVFAPTNRRRDTVTSKGYYRVQNIIYSLKKQKLDFDFELVEGVDYEKNIEIKSKADIIIDDIINETFHNSSIEAACLGAVPVTNYSDNEFPFYKCNLENLEERLKELIINPELLKKKQQEIIRWKNINYTPSSLLIQYEKIYDKIIDNNKLNLSYRPIPTTDDPYDFLVYLKTNNISFALAKESCLEAIKTHKITKFPLKIIVDSQNTKTQLENIFKEKIHCEVIIIDTKTIKINHLNINIPRPIIKYIEKTFNKPWRVIINE